MDEREKQRVELEEFWVSLSPAERRERIALRPAFRDAYNEITQAHRQFPIGQYLWEKWLPVLGPLPIVLYMQLRRYCFFNPKTGEKRDICWPKQETLARDIGVKDRKTVRKGLLELERWGFIERERTHYKDEATGRPHQGTDRYKVYFEVPLTAEDAVEVLLRRLDQAGEGGGMMPAGYEGRKSPHRLLPVDNSAYVGNKSPHGGGEKIPSRNVTLKDLLNVNNVAKEVTERQRLKPELTVRTFDGPQKERLEMLTSEIGENLKTWAGQWDRNAHRSEGFHRRVAYVMPEVLIREALMATRDAVERARSGGEALRGGPAAYFAGVVKNIALREGIDLGLRRGAPSRVGDASG